MDSKNMQEKLNMFDEFRDKYWTANSIKNISLEDYTNLNGTSFTYDVETWSRPLGSIKGRSSFIFGIYHRQDLSSKQNNRQYVYGPKYAWDKKFGRNEQEAFENVRNAVNDVIINAQKSNFSAIDKNPLDSMFKWKLAFLYQNKEDVSITPVFTYAALRWYVKSIGKYKNGMTMSELYLTIKDYEKFSDIAETIELSANLWDDYTNFNLTAEKNSIKYSRKLSENQKSNATSSLELIEYEMRAHKILRRNPHNKMEKSFRKYLEDVKKAQNIVQDENYIDFQFDFNNQKYICELKPSDNQKDIKYAVQSATGQILRYSFDKTFDYKIIVFQGKPDKENLQFLEYLRNEHNIFYLYEESEGIFRGNIL